MPSLVGMLCVATFLVLYGLIEAHGGTTNVYRRLQLTCVVVMQEILSV